MKRVGFLFEKMVEIDNIVLAIKHATKNKKNKRGIVKDCAEYPEKYAKRIRKMLVEGTYRFAQPIETTRRERKKVRHIKVPLFYPDQIIHWALMQVLNPIINRGMDRYCCGSVQGRGSKAAMKAVEKFDKQDKSIRYIFKADIRHFFESVDTGVLKKKFRAVIKDPKILKMIDEILDNGGDGLPIGYYTSQGFSNFYLQRFDHEAKEKCHVKHLIRYADDVYIADTSKRKLHRAEIILNEHLKKEGLHFKGDWQVWKARTRPVDFVGYRFYDGFTLLRKKMFYALNRAVRKINRFGMRIRQVMRYLSYCGWTKRINFRKYYEENIKDIISHRKAKKFMSKYAYLTAKAA